MKKEKSKRLFERAQQFIPGGVNSPVRAFKAVGGEPPFIVRAKGPFIYDEDGNEFIELINSWGPMILGHAHPDVIAAVNAATKDSLSFGAPTRREIEIAELIVEMVPSIEKVRMVNSGTEATMSAIRLARGYTDREKVIKFSGCYHGHGDSFLIAAGSGAATFGIPDSPGVTKGTARDTLIARFNHLESVTELVEANREAVAAIIVEPVPGNMGCVLPKPEFLQGLRDLCNQHGIVLIFDEVMTGFRLSKGGAQEVYGVRPDLTTLGKIIGGGMPVGAYGGKKEIMDFISPSGPIYQAGTLSGNPVSMAAGYATLKHLNDNPQVYKQAEKNTQTITESISKIQQKLDLNFTINRIGSMYSLFFREGEVSDFESAAESNTDWFSIYFNSMLNQGIYLAPSQYESLFISAAITSDELERIEDANVNALSAVKDQIG